RSAVSPDGRRIALADDTNTVHVRDLATGERVGRPMPHDGPVAALTFSADGSRVLTGEGTVNFGPNVRPRPEGSSVLRISDPEAGTAAALTHAVAVVEAPFGDAPQRLFHTLNERTVQFRDAFRGQPIGPPLEHTLPVNRVLSAADLPQ